MLAHGGALRGSVDVGENDGLLGKGMCKEGVRFGGAGGIAGSIVIPGGRDLATIERLPSGEGVGVGQHRCKCSVDRPIGAVREERFEVLGVEPEEGGGAEAAVQSAGGVDLSGEESGVSSSTRFAVLIRRPSRAASSSSSANSSMPAVAAPALLSGAGSSVRGMPKMCSRSCSVMSSAGSTRRRATILPGVGVAELFAAERCRGRIAPSRACHEFGGRDGGGVHSGEPTAASKGARAAVWRARRQECGSGVRRCGATEHREAVSPRGSPTRSPPL